MTDQEKKEIKNIISERIKELTEDIASMEVNNKPVAPDNAYGRLSRMEAIGSKAISDSALSDKKVLLQRLNYALSFIETERYGYCKKCNGEISIARLKAVPYAVLCINCA